MKKFISAVVLTATVLTAVACEVEPLTQSSFQNLENPTSFEFEEINELDSVLPVNYIKTTFDDDPGDEVLIIVPPKKIK